jgi:hypothetical protein
MHGELFQCYFSPNIRPEKHAESCASPCPAAAELNPDCQPRRFLGPSRRPVTITKKGEEWITSHAIRPATRHVDLGMRITQPAEGHDGHGRDALSFAAGGAASNCREAPSDRLGNTARQLRSALQP